jgi:D-arabinose 1-dehydrogenase-like Zn-dependent alcohol dehydrogenase
MMILGSNTFDTAVQYAKAMELKVIGMDISDSQLQAVKALGADVVINTLKQPDFGNEVKQLTNGGCHAAAVFSASNLAYESAPQTLRYVFQLPARPLSVLFELGLTDEQD